MKIDEKSRIWRRWLIVGMLTLCGATASYQIVYVANASAGDDAAAAPAGSSSQSLSIQAMAAPGMSGDPVAEPVSMPSDPQQAQLIARGRYLAVAGDCQYCHSIPGAPPYSGGLSMGLPIGTVYTPNITSSKTYGIGNWTDQQFWNVLHWGIEPGSSLLIFPKYVYPSMPYDAYSKLSYDDVRAIKAYLDSIAPAEIPSRPPAIPVPLNMRAPLLGWRILFFHPQPIVYDPSWSASVRNGAYLVQALEHCSDCHTPRNILLASETDRFLGGGHIPSQSWYAPDITSDKQDGVGGWPAAQLVQYLHDGGSLGAGSPYGPMKYVVDDSLSRMPVSDSQDIAAYLQTAVGPQQTPHLQTADNTMVSQGAQVYATNCARCHGANGEGVTNNFPNLAGNQSVWNGPSNDLLSVVIGGFDPWHNNQSSMPAFRAVLSDNEIAAVANYVRTSWGNPGVADATGENVGALRPEVANVVWLDTATTQVQLSSGTAFDDISGSLTRDANGENCQLDLHLSATATAPGNDGIRLYGACANGGAKLNGFATENGQTEKISLNVSNTASGSRLLAVTLNGPIGTDTINARISMVTPNE